MCSDGRCVANVGSCAIIEKYFDLKPKRCANGSVSKVPTTPHIHPHTFIYGDMFERCIQLTPLLAFFFFFGLQKDDTCVRGAVAASPYGSSRRTSRSCCISRWCSDWTVWAWAAGNRDISSHSSSCDGSLTDVQASTMTLSALMEFGEVTLEEREWCESALDASATPA